jgi:altronate dehydratase
VDDARLLLLNPLDNVLVARAPLALNEVVMVSGSSIKLTRPIPLGHKIARWAIAAGEAVLKYGAPIGIATHDIAAGEHVHTHNVISAYTPTYSLEMAQQNSEAER